MSKLHVAVLANLKKNAPILPGMPADYWADLDSDYTLETIANALWQGGHQVSVLEGDVTLYDRLRDVKPDICFNIPRLIPKLSPGGRIVLQSGVIYQHLVGNSSCQNPPGWF